MGQECPKNATDTAETPLLRLVEPLELYAAFTSGGSVRVERFGDDAQISKAIGRDRYHDERFIVVGLSEDDDPKDACDSVSAHHDMFGSVDGPDVSDIDRAIRVLQGAREALLTAGMVRS